MKRAAALILAVCLLLGLCACGETEKENALTVWVLSDDYGKTVQWCAKKAGYEVNAVTVPQFDAEFSDNAPDIVMLTSDMLPEFLSASVLSPVGINKDGFYDYTIDLASKNGKLYALPWHASPGLFAYRRSLAKAYFGTDEPEEMARILSSWDNFSSASVLLSTASDGKTSIVSGVEDILRPYFASQFDFSEDDFISGSDLDNFFNYVNLSSSDFCASPVQQWSEAWFAGMQDSQAVFGYFLSEVALTDVLTEYSGNSSGDWAVIAPFAPYFWGGAWLAVPAKSAHREEAQALLGALSKNEMLEKACLYGGFFTANDTANSSAAADGQFSLSLLGGQDYFSALSDCAKRIKIDRGASSDDNAVMSAIAQSAIACAEEECSPSDALMSLRKKIL